jgi:hypothetical protein
VGYRDELEALRARAHAAEVERVGARAEAERLKRALLARRLAPSRARTPEVVPSTGEPWRSIPGGEPTPITVINESARKLAVYWLSYDGKPRSAGTLVPGGRLHAHTNVGHCWRFVDARTGEVLQHTHVMRVAGDPVIAYRDEP